MNLIFLDVETTGTEDYDRLVQVAYKTVPGGETASELFKPPLPISVDAMAITHITNKMVKDCPAFVGSRMFKDLEVEFGNKGILVAHNARFDKKMLEREGLKLGSYICTMKLAHHHDKKAELPKHTLQYLRYNFDIEVEGQAHDAMGDVNVLCALFDYYKQFYTVEEMLEICSRPILLKKMMFGKYKGETFPDILKRDKNYLEWVQRDVKMDEDLEYTINHYLHDKQ